MRKEGHRRARGWKREEGGDGRKCSGMVEWRKDAEGGRTKGIRKTIRGGNERERKGGGIKGRKRGGAVGSEGVKDERRDDQENKARRGGERRSAEEDKERRRIESTGIGRELIRDLRHEVSPNL